MKKILSKICYCFKLHSSDDSRFAYLFAAAGGNISRKKKTKFTGNMENNTSSLIDIMNSFSFWTHKVGVFVWILHFTLSLFMLQFAHQGHSWCCWLCVRVEGVGWVWWLIAYHFSIGLCHEGVFLDLISHEFVTLSYRSVVYLVKDRDLFVNEWLENYARVTWVQFQIFLFNTTDLR